MSVLMTPLSLLFLVSTFLSLDWKYQLFVMVNITHTNTRHRNHISWSIKEISQDKKLAKLKITKILYTYIGFI